MTAAPIYATEPQPDGAPYGTLTTLSQGQRKLLIDLARTCRIEVCRGEGGLRVVEADAPVDPEWATVYPGPADFGGVFRIVTVEIYEVIRTAADPNPVSARISWDRGFFLSAGTPMTFVAIDHLSLYDRYSLLRIYEPKGPDRHKAYLSDDSGERPEHDATLKFAETEM